MLLHVRVAREVVGHAVQNVDDVRLDAAPNGHSPVAAVDMQRADQRVTIADFAPVDLDVDGGSFNDGADEQDATCRSLDGVEECTGESVYEPGGVVVDEAWGDLPSQRGEVHVDEQSVIDAGDE